MINVQIGGQLQPQEQHVQDLGKDLSNLFGSVSQGVKTYNEIGTTAARLQYQSDSLEATNTINALNESLEANRNSPEAILQYQKGLQFVSNDLVAKADKFSDHKDAYDLYSKSALEFSSSMMGKYMPLSNNMFFTADENQKSANMSQDFSKRGNKITQADIDSQIEVMRTTQKAPELIKPLVEKEAYTSVFEGAATSINAILPEDLQMMVTNPDGSFNQKGAIDAFHLATGGMIVNASVDEDGKVIIKTNSEDGLYADKASAIYHQIASAYKAPRANAHNPAANAFFTQYDAIAIDHSSAAVDFSTNATMKLSLINNLKSNTKLYNTFSDSDKDKLEKKFFDVNADIAKNKWMRDHASSVETAYLSGQSYTIPFTNYEKDDSVVSITKADLEQYRSGAITRDDQDALKSPEALSAYTTKWGTSPRAIAIMGEKLKVGSTFKTIDEALNTVASRNLLVQNGTITGANAEMNQRFTQGVAAIQSDKSLTEEQKLLKINELSLNNSKDMGALKVSASASTVKATKHLLDYYGFKPKISNEMSIVISQEIMNLPFGSTQDDINEMVSRKFVTTRSRSEQAIGYDSYLIKLPTTGGKPSQVNEGMLQKVLPEFVDRYNKNNKTKYSLGDFVFGNNSSGNITMAIRTSSGSIVPLANPMTEKYILNTYTDMITKQNRDKKNKIKEVPSGLL